MWEYKVEDFTESNEDLASFLNRHGQDGWQLATVIPASWVGKQGNAMKDQLSSSNTLIVFKRQR